PTANASAAIQRRCLRTNIVRGRPFSRATAKAPQASGRSANVATEGSTPTETRPLNVRAAVTAASAQAEAGAAAADRPTSRRTETKATCGCAAVAAPTASPAARPKVTIAARRGTPIASASAGAARVESRRATGTPGWFGDSGPPAFVARCKAGE